MDGTCLLRQPSVKDDFLATDVNLTTSICAVLVNALSQKREVHLLLHGCNSIRMWQNVEKAMEKAMKDNDGIDVESAEVYGCMTTAQFPAGCVPLLTCAYSLTLGQGTGLQMCEALTTDFLKEWAHVYEGDKQEHNTEGLPNLEERVVFHQMFQK